MTAERKQTYDAMYAAIRGEIRLWSDPAGNWQMVAKGNLSEEAKALLKLVLVELGRNAQPPAPLEQNPSRPV